jgi:hypothetical protein
MKSIKQTLKQTMGSHISTPSNVITFNRTRDVTGDQKNVMDLLSDGSMVMIGQDITRFNPDTLEFVKFNLYGPRGHTDRSKLWTSKLWTPGKSIDLKSTDSVLFVKCSDVFYGENHHTLFVKNDEGWFEYKFGQSGRHAYSAYTPHGGITLAAYKPDVPETPPQFIKLDGEGNNMYLVNNIVTNKMEGIAFGDTPLID